MENEIRNCMESILEFQRAEGRRVAKYLKPRTRRGRKLEELEDSGFNLPEELRELYAIYDGVDCGDKLNQWESNIFLQFDFWPVSDVVRISGRAPRIDPTNPQNLIKFSMSSTPGSGNLEMCAPGFEQSDFIFAGLHPLSSKNFVIFESVLAMLKSVVMAQDEGLISYNEEGKIDYDITAFWQLTKHLNPNATYWELMIDQILDWEVPDMKLPDFGRSKWG